MFFTSVCSLQPHNPRNLPEEPREAEDSVPPWVHLDLLPDASRGRRKRCDGLLQTNKDLLMYPKHQIHIQSRLSVDALHSWTLSWVCLQSCHSLSLCSAAQFLHSVLISQGSPFGLIIPTGINRTAAAVPASGCLQHPQPGSGERNGMETGDTTLWQWAGGCGVSSAPAPRFGTCLGRSPPAEKPGGCRAKHCLLAEPFQSS